MAVRGWKPRTQFVDIPQGASREDPRIGRDEQRYEEKRVQLRRLHHMLCLHAGSRHGERPHDRMFQV